jgi:hypothetical protein
VTAASFEWANNCPLTQVVRRAIASKMSEATTPDRLLTTQEVSVITTLAVSTLRKMRMLPDGGGLPFVKLGRRCVYRRADVERFVAMRIFSSTHQARQAAAQRRV